MAEMPKEPKLLRVEIIDSTCEEGTAYIHHIPADTYWDDIQRAVELFYPDASSVTVGMEEEEE